MDYKEFAAGYGIKDDDSTRLEIIHQNWDKPRQYSSRYLLGIGEVEIAKAMALRAATEFDNCAIPIVYQLNDESGAEMSEDEFNKLLLEKVSAVGHFMHHVYNLEQSNFRGKAIDALIKLRKIHDAKNNGEGWSIFTDDPESFLYDPALFNELTERFPELIKLERYRTLFEEGNFDQLAVEFSELNSGDNENPSSKSFQNPEFVYGDVRQEMWKDQQKYFDNLKWFAGKIVECYEICQQCPDYQYAKTEEIMIGVRTLVQKLIEEQSQKEGQ